MLCGVYYAIVCQNKDDDRKLARVKVRFPWMPGGDKDQAHWALVAAPMCGAEFGTFTLPEVDDTVLVMFLHGDIRRPVVVGGGWNKKDKPPEDNANGKNDFRFIKSRSGHRLLFDDSDKTKLVLTDKENANYLGLGQFASGGEGPNRMSLAAPKPINGSAEKGLAICSLKGTVNLWCPNGKLDIKSMHVELTGNDSIAVKAGDALELEGSMTGGVVASQELSVDGSAVDVK